LITGGQYLEILRKTRTNQANYQKIGNCEILSHDNLEATFEQMQNALAKNNPDKPREFFIGSSCPVFKVCTSKGIWLKTKTGYKINAKLSENQIMQARKICERL
jgi:hypothetical protein